MIHEHLKQGIEICRSTFHLKPTRDCAPRMESLASQHVHYRPESWRDDNYSLSLETRLFNWLHRSRSKPDVQDQSAILELLGRINYRILSGKKVYIEVGGVVYKTLYGGYWRSVFTGIEHYLLRCVQVSVWNEGPDTARVIDLPIAYSREGWTAKGHSVSFVLSQDNQD